LLGLISKSQKDIVTQKISLTISNYCNTIIAVERRWAMANILSKNKQAAGIERDFWTVKNLVEPG
jgi:hypothetical protein